MKTARKIMAALSAAGHESYIVGGAVRDMVRGVRPADIDIATSAMPERIVEIIGQQGWKAIMVGVAFGVVVVVAAGRSYEVATLRSEQYGRDSHRPEKVILGVSLAQDLARRDFTINAMAMDSTGRLIDLFGGRDDLAAGIIRAVGDPRERFAEDALRMFRAARFAARFNFTLEGRTLKAIPVALERVNGLSVERVRNEIEQTLLAEFASHGLDIMLKTGLLAASCQAKEQGQIFSLPILPELSHLDGVPQNPCYHCYDVWHHTLAVVDLAPPSPVLRWAALLHDIAKGWPEVRTLNRQGQPSDPGHDRKGAAAAAVILDRLKVERQTVAQVTWLIRHHLFLPALAEKAVIKWLKRLSRDFKKTGELEAALLQLFELHEADRRGGHTQPDLAGLMAVREMVRSVMDRIPFFPDQLTLSGREIAGKLGNGPEVGRFQHNLLTRIQAGQLCNNSAALMMALDARVRRLARKTRE
ncbi:CCA tRNA nucleotidyltransferase [Sporomusa acidovorans]|uniref:CCA-adding enzyme n=1 Tax=Sporomusa acidovorans (strain ATCC 49682 / DSM 3132 / Mol) TaxID=1123286 RepID=A0ABZ3JA11_SPOA4|nr:HD domain-containing protein [Sporomusa acidovorans]OZC21668.1 CCA-adding enzyme [Sporomusa acidovorans DSM 3132]SDD60609.1 tRNA nucleotidyltransferase/poly(A) polymerase [Sporomusa acidovorans]